MTLSKLIRQTHRWLAIIFTLIVVANFIALGMGYAIEWLYYLPLPPLFLMIATGLYMLALPYTAKWRAARAGSEA